MCSRFFRTPTRAEIAAAFGVSEDDVPLEAAPSYNIAPSSMQPVVVADAATGGRALRVMRWGLVPAWVKDLKTFKASTINAKAETLLEKPMWKGAFTRRRCLVPASGFYEWKSLGGKDKQPYAFRLAGDGVMAMGGLWEHWRAPDGGVEWDSFAIVTTEPNELTRTVHDRMPLILEPTKWGEWLDTRSVPVDLLRPLDAGAMRMYPVDRRVGNVRNNEPSLCEAVAP
jgi:putative SOS response-associated peptidase YedK